MQSASVSSGLRKGAEASSALAPPAAFAMSAVGELSLEEVAAEVVRVRARQQELEQHIESVLASRAPLLAAQLKSLSQPSLGSPAGGSALKQLGVAQGEAAKVLGRVRLSCEAARKLSHRVRDLDQARSRLHSVLLHLDKLLDLKTTISQVESALRSKDYERAAQHTFRVLHLHSHRHRRLQHHLQDPSFQVVVEQEVVVREQILAACESAQSREEVGTVLRCARLFPLLGLDARGLVIYCQAVRQALAQSLHKGGLTLKAQPLHAVLAYPELLAKTYDAVARTLHEHAKPLHAHFCKGAELRLLQELQRECDVHVTQLLKHFVATRHLALRAARTLHKAKPGVAPPAAPAASGPNKPDKPDPADLDPRHLDTLLEEISFISRESEIFDFNLRQRAAQAKTQLLGLAARHEEREEREHRGQQPAQEAAQEAGPGTTGAAGLQGEARAEEECVERRAFLLGQSLAQEEGGLELRHCSQVNECVQEVLCHYVTLEQFYMLSNLHKAFQLDEHVGGTDPDAITVTASSSLRHVHGHGTPEHGCGWFSLELGKRFESSLTSTVVDDVFFILKKCTERAFSTGSVSAACALVNHVNSVLAADFTDHLLARLKAYLKDWGASVGATHLPQLASTGTGTGTDYAGGFAKMLAGAGGVQAAGTVPHDRKMNDDEYFLVYLNNLEVASTHISTLKQHLEREFSANFHQQQRGGGGAGAVGAEARAMVDHCLNDLTETGARMHAELKKRAVALSALLDQRVRSWVEPFLAASYELKEAEYLEREREAQDPFARRLCLALKAELSPLGPCLSELCLQLVVGGVAQAVAARVEALVFKKAFTFWGGLQFDKDVRQLSALFSSSSSSLARASQRSHFSRLVQLSSILQLDKASEVLDFWGDQPEHPQHPQHPEHPDPDPDLRSAKAKLPAGSDVDLSRLDAAEVRKVLRLRVDFSKKDINALKL